MAPTAAPRWTALNRELREAQNQIERAEDDPGRHTAAARGARAASQLLAMARSCAHLIRVDLTAQPPVVTPAGPVPLPGDTGALLVEVRSGGEGLHFSTGTSDLSLPSGESSLVPIDVATEGVTYALVGLEHVPFHRTTLRLELRRPGPGPVPLTLDVETLRRAGSS
ncbi:MAG: hypothetical protein M5U12_34510 [Verrucomicrobia bacterium]|nr:hypothetical protein [Verrucomicrobiota bacterium]